MTTINIIRGAASLTIAAQPFPPAGDQPGTEAFKLPEGFRLSGIFPTEVLDPSGDVCTISQDHLGAIFLHAFSIDGSPNKIRLARA